MQEIPEMWFDPLGSRLSPWWEGIQTHLCSCLELWTEEPGVATKPQGHKELGTTEATEHTCNMVSYIIQIYVSFL